MTVVAVSTPRRPDWRWRIVNYAGEVIEESSETFATIALAIAEGARRLEDMHVVDRSTPPAAYVRSTTYLRARH